MHEHLGDGGGGGEVAIDLEALRGAAEARVGVWLKAWDSQGIHRTATPGDEAGATWLARFTQAFPKSVWLNPEPEGLWQHRQSIAIILQLMGNKMFPLTIAGLERAMRQLTK